MALPMACVLALAAAEPASAAPPLWSITKRVVRGGLLEGGASQGFSVACASGTTPIAGSFQRSGSAPASSFQRELEEVEYGSGGRYSVWVRSIATSPVDIYLTVYCVPTSYFTASAFKYGVYTANSSGVATGYVHCDQGWYALSARTTFNTFSGTTVRSSTPDQELDGWYAVGQAPSGKTMTIEAHCVPAADIPNLRMAYGDVALTGGSVFTAAYCPAGMRPLVGGTWQSAGGRDAVTTTGEFTETGMGYTTIGGTGTMTANLGCVPASNPTVSIGGAAPTPAPDSSSAVWTFTVADPAAGAGFTTTAQCRFDGGPISACVSPHQRDGLADGVHTLDVRAVSSDGRIGSFASRDVTIATIPPPPEIFHDGFEQP
jgi:hypothetical protein